jgi:hypothetical protein
MIEDIDHDQINDPVIDWQNRKTISRFSGFKNKMPW